MKERSQGRQVESGGVRGAKPAQEGRKKGRRLAREKLLETEAGMANAGACRALESGPVRTWEVGAVRLPGKGGCRGELLVCTGPFEDGTVKLQNGRKKGAVLRSESERERKNRGGGKMTNGQCPNWRLGKVRPSKGKENWSPRDCRSEDRTVREGKSHRRNRERNGKACLRNSERPSCMKQANDTWTNKAPPDDEQESAVERRNKQKGRGVSFRSSTTEDRGTGIQ